MIRLHDLRKTYVDGGETVEVLRGLQLEVAAGAFVAIVGASGSGKSSLLHILGGLDRGYTGEARVLGHDLGKLPERELARFRNREVGFVFQSYNLLQGLRAWENVLLPVCFGAGGGEGTTREQAFAALARVGLAGKEHRLPRQLSGGERQRVAVARALARRPRLVLADEPTGSLDGDAAEEVVSLLAQLNREQGIGVIVATHDPRVFSEAQRVLRLRDGMLEEVGP